MEGRKEGEERMIPWWVGLILLIVGIAIGITEMAICAGGWDKAEEAHAAKLVEREAERLNISFEAARADGFSRFIVFLHYPPTSILERNSLFTAMAEKHGAEQVIYAHCHGDHRFHDSIEGRHHGILYRLVSGDFLEWMPLQIL